MSAKDTSITREEQRILAFRVQASAFGLPIPIGWGQARLPGNLMWYGDFIAHSSVSEQTTGGKGGPQTTQRSITYSYTAALAMLLCEGPVSAVGDVWKDKQKFRGTYLPTSLATTTQFETVPASLTVQATSTPYHRNIYVIRDWGELGQILSEGTDYTVSETGKYVFNATWLGHPLNISYSYALVSDIEISALEELNMSLRTGSYSQTAWAYLLTFHPEEALAYRGVAYVVSEAYFLSSGASLPNHNFEVLWPSAFDTAAGIFDANPKVVLEDFLTNVHYGVGYPSASIGNWTQWSNYCIANGIFLSPVIMGQRPAAEFAEQLARITNTAPVASEGVLKMVPYSDEAATGNGVTYTPDVAPIYDLNDDDFLHESDEDPVRLSRSNPADAFNQQQVLFDNRDNDYNQEPVEAKDQANIEEFGLRSDSPFNAAEIKSPTVARIVAQQMMQRRLYVRENYEFKLPWNYALLEPMDVLLITDAGLGLSQARVRIKEIVENDDDSFTITAEEFPTDVAQAALYGSQEVGGYSTEYNALPGNIQTPVILEPPAVLTAGGGLEMWIAAIGIDEEWGGCEVWLSLEDQTYERIGQIMSRSRFGVLSNSIGAGTDPDLTTQIQVNLATSQGSLLSGVQTDADQGATACWVEGEVLSYQTAELTAQFQYTLKTYLRRGQFNTTPAAHAAGSRFVRLDEALFRWPFQTEMVGRTVYFKFPSFNRYGGGLQSLAEVSNHAYLITGAALNEPPADITDFASRFNENITELYWSAVSDWRTPIGYEVRFGPSFDSAKVIARIPDTKIQAIGDGMYWVVAYFETLNGTLVYSEVPDSLLIEGTALFRNVLQVWDERATGWGGTFTPGAILHVATDTVRLDGVNNILDIADWINYQDILYGGGVVTSGAYTIPTGHRVNIGRVAPCLVMLDITSYGEWIYDNILTIPDILNTPDILGARFGRDIRVLPQIRTAGEDGIFGEWQNWAPGFYNAKHFDVRTLLVSTSAEVNAVMSEMVLTVDVPDRVERGENIVVGTGGLSVTFTPPFNSNPPNTQITILDAVAGDDAVLSGQTSSGFTVVIKNGGANVQRTINRFTLGY